MGYACPEYREVLRLEDVNKVSFFHDHCISSLAFLTTLLGSPLPQYAASYSSNFHKQGLVHFDCSAIWVRDRTLLTEALDVTPEVSPFPSLSFPLKTSVG